MSKCALVLVSVLACAACAGGEVADDGGHSAAGSGGAASGGTAGTAGASNTGGAGASAGKGGSAGAAGSSSGAAGASPGQGGSAGVGGAGAGMGGVGAGSGASAGAGATAGTTGGVNATGGSPPVTGGAAGSAGTGGAAGVSGSAGTSGCDLTWPTPSGNEDVDSTIEVDDAFDGEMKRFVGTGPLGTSGSGEDQGAIFRLSAGATLENVILGSPAADGIHCEGSCTLRNVWWEDVGEDAATLKGDDESQEMLVDCGGARQADDKVFQHNGPGTFIVRNFTVENFGKLYRSCGNCDDQYTRHSLFEDIVARGGRSIAGVNENYDDRAEFHRLTIYGSESSTPVCVRWQGNDTGAEPITLGDGADGQHCVYEDSDIEYR